MTTTPYKLFDIHAVPLKKGRKTTEHYVVNRSGDDILGVIKWYGAWRRYCLFTSPGAEIVWSSGCLDDIQDYMKKLKPKP